MGRLHCGELFPYSHIGTEPGDSESMTQRAWKAAGQRPGGGGKVREPFKDHATLLGFKIPVPGSIVIKLLQ